MALYESIKAIEDGIVNTLINATIPGVNGIVFDPEIRDGVVKPTYLHVFHDTTPIEDATILVGEDWRIRFTVMAVSSGYDAPTPDVNQAREIALRAGSALIAGGRKLGIDSPYIPSLTIVRVGWQASYTRELPGEGGQLFGAAMEFEVRFLIREV